ncbi:MAG TPA: FAD-dependent oxidoreductase [Oscillospiraceae bacterium]|nr:FAD-dependent oxidoreductase [Oscillospiraceae bacterium]HPS35606.1 FAD-dependent oxidoreductase [Oscillospiraceae bacterium]
MNLREILHHADVCVVGGGLAGMCAAISAARRGAKVVLMQDRPVLGGNASSEIRMWVGGARGMRETGLIEEINIENMWRNPERNYSIRDSILYEKVRFEPNIDLLLNCSCNGLAMASDSRIASVRGWQLTTYTWHTVTADYFIDCSGDSILAPLSGAAFTVGRESSAQYGEDIAPETADKKTMGLSCLMQMRQYDRKIEFKPPFWAEKITKEQLENRGSADPSVPLENWWWMELGGTRDTIHDTEEIRDDLQKLTWGVVDYVKNSGEVKADDWGVDWVGMLPGKRESRRYIGDHVLTQNDVRSEGRFEDIVAYGGWPMDDHHPDGFRHKGPPTVYHPAPSLYGIPYRCIYSVNIDNLLFAGRNISATHAAMSSSRVMATCAVLGQAVGTAAALCVKYAVTPRGIYLAHLGELKEQLLEDDATLPFNRRKPSPLTLEAAISPESAEILRNGIDRELPDSENKWVGKLGESITFSFESTRAVHGIRMVFDSDLRRETIGDRDGRRKMGMNCNLERGDTSTKFPDTMVKSYRVEVWEDGEWKTVAKVTDNHQRLVVDRFVAVASAVRFTPLKTHGCPEARIFAVDIL